MGKKNNNIRFRGSTFSGDASEMKKALNLLGDSEESTSEEDEIENHKKFESSLNLPIDARMIFEEEDGKIQLSIKDNEIKKIRNLYLLHNRFSKFLKWENEKDRKLESFLPKSKRNEQTPKNLLSRTSTNILSNYDESQCIKVEYNTLDKLMIGTGGESPYKSVSLMTFHHIYGIPYLPSSAIKGMFRSYWTQENLQGLEKLFGPDEVESENEEKKLLTKEKLIFFDIFPKKYDLISEVMTPHHASYYSDGNNPTDDEDPKPLTFPALENAHFDIYVACEEPAILEKYEIKDHLEKAFKYYGIGAKIALGYGLAK